MTTPRDPRSTHATPLQPDIRLVVAAMALGMILGTFTGSATGDSDGADPTPPRVTAAVESDH